MPSSDRFGTPSLITRITNDVNQVQLAVALGVRMLIRWPFLAVGSMCAALAIDLKLGMIFLICTPAIGLVFWFVMARCIPYYRQLQAKLDRIALICREGLSGAAWSVRLCAKITSVSVLPRRPMTRRMSLSRWASSRRFSTPSRFW